MSDTVFSLVQKLEPGADVWLFDLDASSLGGDMLRFHGYTQVGSILWQGNTYDPWPLKASGFERTGDQQPQPKFTVANIDGSISLLCNQFEDLVGSKVVVHHTFGQFLDGQPGADPAQEFSPDIWYVDSKSSESSDAVEFTLAGAMDFAGQQLPSRQIIANSCSWISRGGYRGPFCGYTGGPVADINDVPTSILANDNCSGTIVGCKFRFGATGQLAYGSFPAAGLARTS